MLRRVACVLRIGLLAFGVALLLWLPASAYFSVSATFPLSAGDSISTASGQGYASIGFLRWYPEDYSRWNFQMPIVTLERHDTGISGDPLRRWLAPAAGSLRNDLFRIWQLDIPLWLLAVLCLAWPVTSFILARRRRVQGFPIEPAPPAEP